MTDYYYWIVGDYMGKTVILGAFKSDTEAYQIAYQKLDCPFNIELLPTRDKARAASIIKAKKLNSTGNLEKSLERVRHTV